jgi:hypothetical protein
MKKPVDMTLITLYLVTGLTGYGVGLLSIYTVREATGCYEPVFYAISGLIAAAAGVYLILAAMKEAIREARGEENGKA